MYVSATGDAESADEGMVWEMVTSANKTFHNELLSPLTITLGDEFQGLSASLSDSMDILLFLEEYRDLKTVIKEIAK